MIKVAFICWNDFQIYHFRNVIKHFISYDIIIVDKGNNIPYMHLEKLINYNFKIIKGKYIPMIDGVYDIIFFQSPFPNIERISLSKLVSVQYGLAKERHNYGEWRSLADMNLMYGNYSTNSVSYFSPSFSVGNPKFDNLANYVNSDSIRLTKNKLELNPDKKTILYLPTWGDLSSFNNLINEFSKLVDKYNIILKMHHNNEIALSNWRDIAKRCGINRVYYGGDDLIPLLSVSDLVISDFSGAIFDAMYMDKPILLYQENAKDKVGIQKFNLDSIEYRLRDQIGNVCDDKTLFIDSLEDTFNRADYYGSLYHILKKDLFITLPQKSSSELIYEFSVHLNEGQIPPLSFNQRCVRECVQECRRLRRSNKTSLIDKFLNFKIS